MFWNKNQSREEAGVIRLNATETVTKVSKIYAELNEQRQLIKPRSSLPCTWFHARESFMTAYEAEFLDLSEELRNSYHHVYRELSFFVDDDLFKDFNTSLDVAVMCRIERSKKLGITEDEISCRSLIASEAVKVLDRGQIWASVAREKTCPREHGIVIWYTLVYCNGMYRAMWDEWAAFSNLILHRKGKPE